MRRAFYSLLTLIVVGLLSGCGVQPMPTAHDQKSADVLGPQARFLDLEHPGRNVSLFSLFNREQSIPRVVLLISPT